MSSSPLGPVREPPTSTRTLSLPVSDQPFCPLCEIVAKGLCLFLTLCLLLLSVLSLTILSTPVLFTLLFYIIIFSCYDLSLSVLSFLLLPLTVVSSNFLGLLTLRLTGSFLVFQSNRYHKMFGIISLLTPFTPRGIRHVTHRFKARL